MNRIPLMAIAALALVAAPTLALSDHARDTDRKGWYVEIGGGGLCYVRYQPRPAQGLARKYISADHAYKGLIANPRCSISAGQLMQLGYGN
jgi:hypothetical protein